jgi:dUTP pyrophosphatase
VSDLEWRVRRLRASAKLPTKAHADDAGWDLYYCAPEGSEGAAPSLTASGDARFVALPTGLAMAFSPGWVFKIEARSGWASKFGVSVLAGVVDAGYRGEVIVLLRVPADGSCRIAHGDKIAQGLFLPVPEVAPVEVDELPGSLRGTKGWGSTG